MQPEQHTHDSTQHTHDDGGTGDLVAMLDLDGEVLDDYWTDALDWVAGAAIGAERIVDLGAGTGTAALLLARRFGDAEVVAVDSSAVMLDRLRVKAAELGLAQRITTVEADLDLGWPDLGLPGPGWPGPGDVDIAWASMSLHHMADPDRLLREVFAATRAGGVLGIAEFSEPLSFLPRNAGPAGIERRVLDALTRAHAHTLPDLGSDWSPRIAAAGFAVVGERVFDIDLTPPSGPAAGRYAHHWFRRLHAGLADELGADDLAAVAELVRPDGPLSLLHRNDVHIRGTRTVTLARRP